MAQLGQPCWIDITVTSADDRERLVAFLCDTFDWTAEVNGPETGYYTMLRRDGFDVAAVGQQAQGAPQWVTYLATDDIEVSGARVRELGGQLVMGPHTVMRAGTMAVAVDPVGAMVGLWQADLFAGFDDTIGAGRPEWFHHGSPNPQAAVDFYCATFDLSPRTDDGDTIVERDGRGFFSLGHNIAGNPPDIKPVILVDDLEHIEERIARAGGEIYASRVPIPGGVATTFADPVVHAPLVISMNAP